MLDLLNVTCSTHYCTINLTDEGNSHENFHIELVLALGDAVIAGLSGVDDVGGEQESDEDDGEVGEDQCLVLDVGGEHDDVGI